MEVYLSLQSITKKNGPKDRRTKKTGFYSIYSAVGLGLKNMTEELEFLNNIPLTEAKMLDKIRGIWNRFVSYLKNIWNKAKEYQWRRSNSLGC